jgi:hypothetical protein
MLKPIGMTEGHYECRSLDETLPIFTELLAAEVVERTEKQAVVKHPNTAWKLVIHEGGSDSKNKPHTNHYGFRVATSKEVPKAHEYISEHKARYKIKSVTPPHEAHFAYSIYFKELAAMTSKSSTTIRRRSSRAAGSPCRTGLRRWRKKNSLAGVTCPRR